MSGFGTVVTGTLRRGALKVGDEVEIYPSGGLAKVRELQSHNEFTERADPRLPDRRQPPRDGKAACRTGATLSPRLARSAPRGFLT